MQPSIHITPSRGRSVTPPARRKTAKSAPKTKVTVTLDNDTAQRLKTHAAFRGLDLGVAAQHILRPWLIRYGSGRSAEEFRANPSIDIELGDDQTPVADQAA
jgi:hypothetical protein